MIKVVATDTGTHCSRFRGKLDSLNCLILEIELKEARTGILALPVAREKRISKEAFLIVPTAEEF